VGEAPAWVVRITFAVWIAALGMLAWVLLRLVRAVSNKSLAA